MTSRSRAAVLAVFTLLLSGLVVSGLSVPASAAYARKCFSVRASGDAQSHLVCYRPLRRLAPDYRVGYRDSLVNKTSRTAQLDCEASQSTTFTYGGSVSLSGEVKAGIFASIKAEVSVSVSRSLSSGYATKAGVSVPPHTTTYCNRVVYRERFSVCRTTIYYGQQSGCTVFTFQAPSRRGWVLRDA